MAIKANITIDQGADFSATIDVKAADGSVFSLASHTALGQMRKNYSSSLLPQVSYAQIMES